MIYLNQSLCVFNFICLIAKNLENVLEVYLAMSDKENTALLVCGMHRSGTSILTRSFNILGYGVSTSQIGINSTNETGHWESEKLARLNDKLLKAYDASWKDWTPLMNGAVSTDALKNYKTDIVNTIRDDFDCTADIIVKDPRICRLAKIHLASLDDLDFTTKIIHVFRNPIDVMSSLEKRNDIKSVQAAFLWLRYTLDAEFHTRDQLRIFVAYEDFLAAPTKALSKILKGLDLSPKFNVKTMSKEIINTVDSKKCHHNTTAEEVILNPLTRSYVAKAYTALKILETNPNERVALEELDRIRAQFDESSALLKTVLNLTSESSKKLAEESLNKASQLRVEQIQMDQDRTNFETRLNELESRLAGNVSEADSARNAIQELEEKLRQKEGELSQIEGTLVQKGKSYIDLDESFERHKLDSLNEKALLAEEKSLLKREIELLKESHAELAAVNDGLEVSVKKSKKDYLKAVLQIKDRDESLKKQRKTIRNLQKQNWHFQDQLSIANDQLRGLLESSSWKVTRPMRVMKRLIFRQPLRPMSGGAQSKPRIAPFPMKRALSPFLKKAASVSDLSVLNDRELIVQFGDFDASYYLAHYPEVQVSGLTPLEHFLDVGWQKGYQPNLSFNVKAYLATHPELNEASTNPYAHYLREVNSERCSKTYDATSNELQRVGKIAVFGAISGSYDGLKEPLVKTPGADYFMFSDQDIADGSLWQKRSFEFVSSDPTRTARFIKSHPHLYFSDYDWAVWVDANLQINGDLRSLIAARQDDLDVMTWHHPLRDCVYEEAAECAKRAKDNDEVLKRQVKRYAADGLNKHNGLWETSVFVSKMKSPKVVSFMESWWKEILQGSRRDQIGLPQALRKSDVVIGSFAPPGICMRTDRRFNYYRHTPMG